MKQLPDGVIGVLSNGAYVYAPGRAPTIALSPWCGEHTAAGFVILDEGTFLDELNEIISCHIPESL